MRLKLHILVRGVYVGTVRASLGEIRHAFPYSEIIGNVVHVWTPKRWN